MEAKTLEQQLSELKASLETNLTEKAKKQIEDAIKGIEEKLAKIEGKAEAATVTEIKTELDAAKADIKVIKDAADANQKLIDKWSVDGGRKDLDAPKILTFGDALQEAFKDETNMKNLEMLVTKHKDRNKNFSVELKTVGDITTGNVTGSAVYGQQFRQGIIQNPARKVHIRSLVPIGTAGPGNTLTFMRENGDGEGAIAPVAETAAKPQIDFDLIEQTVNFETIAGWLKITRKALRNIPAILSFLQSRLPEKLLRVEDYQLIQGNGTSPNISGITDGGNYTAASSVADTLVEQIIDSLAQLEDDEERDATGILLRPKDYYGFFKHKAGGSGEYDLPLNVTFANGVLYISGVPVFMSTGMIADKYIVGDWDMGAQLLIQEAMRIEFFEQDDKNVQENKVTVRIEETVAFPIFGDNYFIYGSVPAES